MPQDGQKTTLVDLVYSEREDSPISHILAELVDLLSDAHLTPTSALVLDAISIRWALFNVLRGQGMPESIISKIDANPYQIQKMWVQS